MHKMLRLLSREGRSSISDDLHSHDEFTNSGNISSKHVVIVMDGMTEFTTEPLQWTFDNVVSTGCIVTLLGPMPWLEISLFLKTKNDFWTADQFEDLPLVKENGDQWGNGVKNLKRQAVIDLCKKYGVVPQKKIVMGYPVRLTLVEQITALNPTWVVFDRSHRRNKEYYARKISCNMLMMNDDGMVDMVKSKVTTHKKESASSMESPMYSATTPKLIT